MKMINARSSGLRSAVTILLSAVTICAQQTPKAPGTGKEAANTTIKVVVTSILVNDQAKALKFYTEVLGLVKKTDIPIGDARWLTVISPDQPGGPEVLLEPMGFAPAKTYQKALYDAGIPLTSFGVADVGATHERLKKLGVVFRTPPTKMGNVTIAVFEDTCGNWIQIAQQ